MFTLYQGASEDPALLQEHCDFDVHVFFIIDGDQSELVNATQKLSEKYGVAANPSAPQILQNSQATALLLIPKTLPQQEKQSIFTMVTAVGVQNPYIAEEFAAEPPGTGATIDDFDGFVPIQESFTPSGRSTPDINDCVSLMIETLGDLDGSLAALSPEGKALLDKVLALIQIFHDQRWTIDQIEIVVGLLSSKDTPDLSNLEKTLSSGEILPSVCDQLKTSNKQLTQSRCACFKRVKDLLLTIQRLTLERKQHQQKSQGKHVALTIDMPTETTPSDKAPLNAATLCNMLSDNDYDLMTKVKNLFDIAKTNWSAEQFSILNKLLSDYGPDTLSLLIQADMSEETIIQILFPQVEAQQTELNLGNEVKKGVIATLEAECRTIQDDTQSISAVPPASRADSANSEAAALEAPPPVDDTSTDWGARPASAPLTETNSSVAALTKRPESR